MMWIYTIFISFTFLEFTYATHLKINTEKPAYIVSNKFLSVAIDSGVIRHNWGKLDFIRSLKVKSLARSLHPCFVRVGGSEADFLTFSPYGKRTQFNESLDFIGHEPFVNFSMSALQWDELNKFVREAGWSLVFDLNSLLRLDGDWNLDNAQLLMNYSMQKGYTIAGWELGNEPNSYRHKLGFEISASQRVKDYQKLHMLLNQYPQWKSSVIIGPSTTQPNKKNAREYFQDFLNIGGPLIVTNPTFHQYYVDGRTATVDQFLNPGILNILQPEIYTALKVAGPSFYGKVWLGETGSAYGGGAPELSDRYVAGFMWLDKLGISAVSGVDVVVRQSFYGGSYALIDSKTLDPNPDFWLSYLFSKLVGQTVFNVTLEDKSGMVRFYSHCTNTRKTNYSDGSVTVFGMNLKKESTTISLIQFPPDTKVHVYLLQPVGNLGLKSAEVALNGKKLKLNEDFSMPDVLTPIIQRNNVTFPPQTFGFMVVPKSNLTNCRLNPRKDL